MHVIVMYICDICDGKNNFLNEDTGSNKKMYNISLKCPFLKLC